MQGIKVTYFIVPLIIWFLAVLGYTVAYGTILTSTSMPNIIPAFTSEYLGGVIPAIGFMASAWKTFDGKIKISRIFLISILVIGTLVVIWFFLGWEYGLKYQGEFVYLSLLLNLAIISGLVLGYFKLLKFPNLWGKLIMHACFWIWIGWIAFPWLGEYP